MLGFRGPFCAGFLVIHSVLGFRVLFCARLCL